jgi:hypothetical protein
VRAPPSDCFKARGYSPASLSHENFKGLHEELRSLVLVHIVLRSTDFLKPYASARILAPRGGKLTQISGKPDKLWSLFSKPWSDAPEDP